MTDPDRRLAVRARRGDRQALTLLYERYRRRLFGFLVKMLGDRTLAEDVYQEVWIKVLQGITTYDPRGGHFRGWLFRVAANAAVDRRRRRDPLAGVELDAPVDVEGESRIERMSSELPGPDRLGEAEALGRALDRALDGLSERQRTAVLLRHQQGLSYPELARAMNVPEGTAKTMVHRAAARLRRRLKEWIDD
jgi:RNA polymerase sigma-70 factor (ECF subfamily)